MSEPERGAYTPPTSDAPLSFDPRQPVRGARPIPFTLILSVLVLAALVAAIFMFYQSGVREAGEGPRTVGARLGDIKAPPPPGAQPKDPSAGLQIYRAEAGKLETLPEPQFAPPPETPQARPTEPVTVAQAPPAQPAPAAPATASLKPAIPAAAPPPAKPAPAPAPAPEPKAVAGGPVVQIGAVSSRALADRAWSEAIAAAHGLGAGKGKSVEAIQKNGATLYRTAVTGFASRDAAQAFCARLKSARKSCFVR